MLNVIFLRAYLAFTLTFGGPGVQTYDFRPINQKRRNYVGFEGLGILFELMDPDSRNTLFKNNSLLEF